MYPSSIFNYYEYFVNLQQNALVCPHETPVSTFQQVGNIWGWPPADQSSQVSNHEVCIEG